MYLMHMHCLSLFASNNANNLTNAEVVEIVDGDECATTNPVKTCKGVYPGFHTDKNLKAILQTYGLYCAVGVNSGYVLDRFGLYYQV